MSSDLAARLLLYSLPKCGPARASWLAAHPDGLVAAVGDLRRGNLTRIPGEWPRGVTPELLTRWISCAAKVDEEKLLAAHQENGQVIAPGHKLWRFADDPQAPLFLHARGNVDLLSARPAVGIVGTRRCTTVGARFAQGLGADLASAGITVVSGLAKGVDGAAHRGTLMAGGSAIAVVASGLDIIYPKSNETLWKAISSAGLLLGEATLGTVPDRWRFPARNRIIAALSDFVVVVESHASGGALSTAAEAALRGVTVGAVPGSVSSPASAGTNALLADGCPPIRHAQDVLDGLGLFDVSPIDQGRTALDRECESGESAGVVGQKTHGRLGREAQIVVDEVRAGSVHIDALLVATALPIQKLMAVLAKLSSLGVVEIDGATVIATQNLNAPFEDVGLS